MVRPTDEETRLDELRSNLAAAGVPLFRQVPTAGRDTTDGALARLVVDLSNAADTTLIASIPCVFAAHAERAAGIAMAAVELRPDAAKSLGFLHRLARCLCTSRGPDIEALSGLRRCPAALEFESRELQAPEAEYGEDGIADAVYVDPILVNEAVRLFDAWVQSCWSNLAGSQRGAAAQRFRAMLELALRPGT